MSTTVIDCDTCPIRGRGCPECFVSHLDLVPTWLDELSVADLTDTELSAVDALTASGMLRWPGRTTSAAG